MNVRIRDAVNLVQKIATVLKGQGGKKLLESYDLKRYYVRNRVSDSAINNSYSIAKVADVTAQEEKGSHSVVDTVKVRVEVYSTINRLN